MNYSNTMKIVITLVAALSFLLHITENPPKVITRARAHTHKVSPTNYKWHLTGFLVTIDRNKLLTWMLCFFVFFKQTIESDFPMYMEKSTKGAQQEFHSLYFFYLKMTAICQITVYNSKCFDMP